MPVVFTEHCPEAIGHSVRDLLIEASHPTIIQKVHFGIVAEPGVISEIRSLSRNQVVVTGMEAQACGFQSAVGLLSEGFQVFLAADTMSAQSIHDKTLAMERIAASGGFLQPPKWSYSNGCKEGIHSCFESCYLTLRP